MKKHSPFHKIIAVYKLICYTHPMLKLSVNTSKNLLAFSAGIDSSTLFFLLVEENIPFDIAIVDYAQRTSSKDEVIYATQLAHKYNKKCFISTYPKELHFTEKEARDYRYKFFDEIIKKHAYETLLTAHQLNDKLEWFLMQLTRGAGLNEILGLEEFIYKENYCIQRPLLKYSKKELQQYLDKNNYKYFIDETNFNETYTRNYFRHNFSDKLIEEYKDGILRSFEYLQLDQNSLLQNTEKQIFEKLHIYKFNGDINIAIKLIDKDLKQRGYLITKATRDEICEKKELVISHEIAVAITNKTIYIAPYLQKTMDKQFKDNCRIHNIPKHIRPYLYTLKDFSF